MSPIGLGRWTHQPIKLSSMDCLATFTRFQKRIMVWKVENSRVCFVAGGQTNQRVAAFRRWPYLFTNVLELWFF